MLACTIAALKFKATQLLYLHGHITLSMQVYEIASSSIVGVCIYCRKVTEYFGREMV